MLAAHRRTADAAGIEWKAAIHRHIEEQVRAETVMSVERMCTLAKLSRAGYYRFRTTPESGDAHIDLRDAIQRVALEFPSYGRPRITKELCRRGWRVGHNRVYRIMREDNLLCLRRRKFVVTTNSLHDRPIYPNLARDLVVTGVKRDIELSTAQNARLEFQLSVGVSTPSLR